ncbi:MAG: hypothetical protein K0A93_04250 [Desulfuromonadaceae bacterium]|nr:hypothetical protein [Desulfuromonadaceae bacterium]
MQSWTINSVPASDIIADQSLIDFGDNLRIHRCFSREPFTRDKFEFALEAVFRASGVINITGHNVLLKTEATGVAVVQ